VESVQTGTSSKDAVEKVVTENQTMFSRILFDKKKDEKTDQEDLLLCIQKSLLAPMQHQHEGEDQTKAVAGDVTVAGNILLQLITSLVAHDVLEAEGVEAWWENPQSSSSEDLSSVRERTKAVVDFLLQSDDEESDED